MNDVIDNGRSVAPNLQRMDGSKRAVSSSPGGARPTKTLFILVCLLTAPLSTVHASSHSTDEEARELKRAVITNYAAIAEATYQDALAGARRLQDAIDLFLQQPSEPAMKAARQSWLDARIPYLQSEAFRFYDGPIDQVEGFVNAWPLDENFVDYVQDNPGAGIVNAVEQYPVLSRQLILSLNEKEGEKSISTGFHAIEFLLWGQDMNPDGPGNRSWRDYTDTAKNPERRRQYLRIVSGLLVEHLQSVAAAWVEGRPDNYRAEFQSADADTALARILKGIGALSGPELAGERLTVPYETKEQEDEHSCFSDNTVNDVIYDAIGMQNVYLGRYSAASGRKIQGPGVHDLLKHVNPSFAEKLAAQVEDAVSSARGIPAPFDRAIQGTDAKPGRVAVKKCINALQSQSDLIAQSAKVLGIKLNL